VVSERTAAGKLRDGEAVNDLCWEYVLPYFSNYLSLTVGDWVPKSSPNSYQIPPIKTDPFLL
jgi:hypothetical protein